MKFLFVKYSQSFLYDTFSKKWNISRRRFNRINSKIGKELSKELVNSEEGITLPKIGRFYVTKYRRFPRWGPLILNGRVLRFMATNGYIYRVKWVPPKKGLKFNRLFLFKPHIKNQKMPIKFNVKHRTTPYVKEEWSL